MSDIDEPGVSRRQFFRGLAGDLLKVVGEVAGLDVEPEPPPPLSFSEDDIIVPPEKQAATLNEIFGFLEQLGAQEHDDQDGQDGPEVEPAPELAVPEPAPEPEMAEPALAAEPHPEAELPQT